MNNGHNVMKTVLISNLISSVKQRNGLRKVIHIIHNFKKFFGGILSLSPCCLHFVHIVFLFVHTYILELITLFDQFSPHRILPTYPQSYPHYPQKYPHYPSRFYTGVIPNSIHILPRFETVFFFEGVLFYIMNYSEYTDAVFWHLIFG